MNPTRLLLFFSLALVLGLSPLSLQAQKGGKEKKKKKEKQTTTAQTGKKPVAEIDPKTRERIDYLFIEAETQYLQGNSSEATNLFQQVILLDPRNSAAYYNIAKIALENKDASTAVNYGKQALELDPENYWYYAQLSDAYQARMEFDKSAEVLARLVKKFPKDSEAKFDLAQCYIRLNKFPEAIAQYDDLEKNTGMNEEIIYRKQQLYLYLNEFDKALGEVEKLIKAAPYDSRALKAKYEVLMMKGDKTAAFAVLEEMVRLNPDDGFALLSLADYYKDAGNSAKSDDYLLRAFQSENIPLDSKLQIVGGMLGAAESDKATRDRLGKIMKVLTEKHPGSATVMGLRGDLFRVENQKDSAVAYYHKAVELEPSNSGAWEQLLIMEAEAGNFKQMAADAEKALEYFPNNTLILYFSGLAQSELKNYDEAAWALEKVKKLSSNQDRYLEACIQLGEVYFRSGQFAKSDENFEAALAKVPNDALILNNYAWYLSLRGEKLDKAEEMVNKALKESPGNANYMDTYGWVLYKKGDYRNAETWLAKALAANPTSAEVLEHYGDVLYKLGQRDKAIEYWKKAQDNGASELVIENKLNQL